MINVTKDFYIKQVGLTSYDIDLINKVYESGDSTLLSYDSLDDIYLINYIYDIIDNYEYRKSISGAMKYLLSKKISLLIIDDKLINQRNIIMMTFKIISSLDSHIKLSDEEIDFVNQLNNKNALVHHSKLNSFYMFILKPLSTLDIYELFDKAISIKRTGWINALIDDNDIETVGEHTISSMLLASTYLSDNNPSYDVFKIINMCYLHDLGESIIGDIPRPRKREKDTIIESNNMLSLLCNLGYNGQKLGVYYYDIYREFNDKRTYNSKIAHDLDAIQFDYKLMKYKEKYKDNELVFDILSKYRVIEPITLDGFEIYYKLILNKDKKRDE